MPVQITKMSESVSPHKSYLIFGQTKTGKTMLAAGLPKVLFINTENNIDSIEGADISKADCFSYGDINDTLDALLQHKPDYEWVFIDSITDAIQKLYNEIFAKEKDGRQAYQKLELKYIELMDKIKKLPYNVVCVAQQGYIKDEITGGMIFGPTLTWAKLQQNLPYRFSAVLASKTIKDDKGKDIYVLQCHPCPQYAVGVRTKFGKPNPLNGYEKPDLLAIHKKIIND